MITGYIEVNTYDDSDLSNAPQPPLEIRGGEGALCEFDCFKGLRERVWVKSNMPANDNKGLLQDESNGHLTFCRHSPA